MSTSTFEIAPLSTEQPTEQPTAVLPPQTRYRHTVENDARSARVKRVNRMYASRGCDRVVRIVKGTPTLFVKSDGGLRPFPYNTLEALEAALIVSRRGN